MFDDFWYFWTLDFYDFLLNFDDFVSFLMKILPVARRGNGSNFWSKFGAFLKIKSGTSDFWIFL